MGVSYLNYERDENFKFFEFMYNETVHHYPHLNSSVGRRNVIGVVVKSVLLQFTSNNHFWLLIVQHSTWTLIEWKSFKSYRSVDQLILVRLNCLLPELKNLLTTRPVVLYGTTRPGTSWRVNCQVNDRNAHN